MINILYLHAGAEMYGADKVLLELVSRLDKEKFRPIVILPCEGPLVDKLKEKNIIVDIIPYPILRRKYFNLKGIINYTLNYFYYSHKLKKVVDDKKIDIVHVNTFAVLQGVYLKLFSRIKLIWHIHEIITTPKFLNTLLCNLALLFSDKVVTVSEATKQNIKSRNTNNNKLMVIYNGVDNNIYNPQNEYEYLKSLYHIPNNAITIGMIGRVNSWKGQKDFVKAVDPILKKYSNVYGIMVGGVFEGEEYRMTELSELISYSENANRLIVSDFRKDPQNVHNMFDIFVLPSTNPDPLPTVVLEAMASKKPIIAYAHGGVCEMVKNNYNGLFAEVNNVVDLSKKIETLVIDDDLREFMGMNSLTRQKTLFSIFSYVNNFKMLYEEINNETI